MRKKPSFQSKIRFFREAITKFPDAEGVADTLTHKMRVLDKRRAKNKRASISRKMNRG